MSHNFNIKLKFSFKLFITIQKKFENYFKENKNTRVYFAFTMCQLLCYGLMYYHI